MTGGFLGAAINVEQNGFHGAKNRHYCHLCEAPIRLCRVVTGIWGASAVHGNYGSLMDKWTAAMRLTT